MAAEMGPCKMTPPVYTLTTPLLYIDPPEQAVS